MSQRRDIIEAFSTFRVLEDGNGRAIPVLKTDRELQRIIDSLVSQDAPSTNKDAWARYFLLMARQSDPQFVASPDVSASSDDKLRHRIMHLVELAPELNQDVQAVYFQISARQDERRVANFLNNSALSAKKLLSAYLQKICWYAAKDVYEKRIQFSNLRHQYPLEECFHIASLRAGNPINLLQNFKLEHKCITIKSYAEKRLWGIIFDQVRAQNLEARTRSLSDDGLLRTLSKRELTEALKATGNYELEIPCYCLAWECYKEIHQPKTIDHSQLDAPARERLQQIAERYNQRRQKLKIAKSVSWNDIQVILKTCAQVLRVYRSSDSFAGRIASDSSSLVTDPWTILIQKEEVLQQQEAIAQVKSIIASAFMKLPDVAQKTLKLWFGLELSQSDILLVPDLLLGLQKQYEVSRQIKQHKRFLLKTLIQELSEKCPEVFQPRSKLDQIINQVQAPIDECLSQYCKHFFYSPLENQLKLFSYDHKLLFHLRYQQHLSEQQIAEQLKVPAPEVNNELVNLTQSLQENLKQWVETTLDVALGVCKSADQKLTSFIKTWLQDHATSEA
jgi:DNA-directed RNA polymerase specialized sigma subunit